MFPVFLLERFAMTELCVHREECACCLFLKECLVEMVAESVVVNFSYYNTL